MEFTIIRDTDKAKVQALIRKQSDNKQFTSSIGFKSAYSPDFLKALLILTKMKELASEFDIGFAAFFVGPDGSKYFISNLNNE